MQLSLDCPTVGTRRIVSSGDATRDDTRSISVWVATHTHTHTVTSVVRKNVRFFCPTTVWITELDCITHLSLRQSDGCWTVDVACRHVWKLRLHFIFHYLMRHESYGRRTADVAVCELALSISTMLCKLWLPDKTYNFELICFIFKTIRLHYY
jgi:hypothetical protein